jgi:hypothetical protein
MSYLRDRIAELGAAVEYAAATLPEGYIVVIQVENGAGWVELQNPEGNVVSWNDERGEFLSEDVKDAADAAHVMEFGHV